MNKFRQVKNYSDNTIYLRAKRNVPYTQKNKYIAGLLCYAKRTRHNSTDVVIIVYEGKGHYMILKRKIVQEIILSEKYGKIISSCS
jgi:hypothetical protein